MHAFPERGKVARHLKAHGGAVPVLWERDKCYLGGELLDAEEAGVLAALGTSLLLALSANGRLSGFLSLEPKAADEPLSPVDLHGLESIGSSAGLALAEVIRNVRVVRVTDGFNDSPAV